MIKFRLFALLTMLLFGVAAVNAQSTETPTPSNVAITLERTACFGRCPIYTITILEDGTVLYNGERFVDVTGEQQGQIDPATVAAMVQALDRVGYFGWDEAYDHMNVSDLPYVTTSATRDGVTHQIRHYLGDSSAPFELDFVEQWIDEMVVSARWTGVQPDVSTLIWDGSSPVVTLQRSPCFGDCPIYTVALFGDGTVVYTGIAHVDEIGVRVFHAKALEVNVIAQQAEALGYFDWQPSYEQRVMTDQSTVITSVSLDDQFQRITRYNGDPNAPVGLTWIEDNIDRLVARLSA